MRKKMYYVCIKIKNNIKKERGLSEISKLST